MRALVVGGAGFIGRNLCASLRYAGHEVHYNDIFIHGAKQKANIPAFCTASEPNEREWDVVFYLGGLSSAPMFRNWGNYDLCVHSFSDFLRTTKMRRLVLASTSSLYETVPGMENELVRPKTLYELSKLTFEQMAIANHRMKGTDTAIARLFSVYGPHETHKGRYANLVTQMIWAAKKGLPFELYNNGEATRDFTYVGDVVSGLTLLSEHPMATEAGVWNIGTGKSYTLNAVADMIRNFVYPKPLIVSYPTHNPVKNYVSDTLADNDNMLKLGWRVDSPLERGISDTAGFYGR